MSTSIHEFVAQAKRMWELAGEPAAYKVLLDSPVSATRVHVTVAWAEPATEVLGFNWVIVDPSSKYYQSVLQLRSIDPPVSSGVENVITDASLSKSWVLLSSVYQVFQNPEPYSSLEGGTKGPKGDKGDKGTQGEKGEVGDKGLPGTDVVDYGPIIQEAIDLYNN